jgi:alanyl-tRNA synthetase
MNSEEIRQAFLDFFTSRGHQQISGVSLVPKNDPTLLFINSGMAPLKRYFTGEDQPPAPDLCNVQPCIRTTDIEDVGDRHHLTYFEMLGSWSIDHYFKERAIALAFELLVDSFGFEPDRLYATVFAGMPELGLAPDETSPQIWESVGLKRNHIVPLKADNFWGPAGDTGPCGPCTEVFFDTGGAFGSSYQPGGSFDTDHRYIEIWNAGVFMEFNKDAEGKFTKLPFASVDTGSGLERMAMVLGGHETVYETDLLKPIADRARSVISPAADLPIESVRLLADHVRAATMILAEGVRPSNLGRGYIPRRLIRKCVEVVTRAGLAEFPFPVVIDAVTERFGAIYPRLVASSTQIKQGFEQERAEFARVVERGLEQLEKLRAQGDLQISGDEAFSLFATYGMPVELVRDYAQGHGGDVDMAGFNAAFKEHQQRSRVSAARGGTDAARWPAGLDHIASPDKGPTPFLGYDRTQEQARVEQLLVGGTPVDSADEGSWVEVVLDRTPFYPEGGGQVGDRGTLRAGDGVVDILATLRGPGGVIVHRGQIAEGTLTVGVEVEARVDPDHRLRAAANHSATHLLQAALRKTLGDGVRQAGSLVEPSRLRFDFTFPRPLEGDELKTIEQLVNEQILADLEVKTETMAYREAVRAGALTLPGETYGENVRVVRMGTVSSELCGGTHVPHTSRLGLFRLVSESSVASGVRRIVAVTREGALDMIAARQRLLDELTFQLGVGIEALPQRIRTLLEGSHKSRRQSKEAAVTVEAKVRETIDKTPFVAAWHSGDSGSLRESAFDLAQRHHAVVFLASDQGDAVRVVVVVPDALRGKHDASMILKQITPAIEGSGGGNQRLAQGGGRNPKGVNLVMQDFASFLSKPSDHAEAGVN